MLWEGKEASFSLQRIGAEPTLTLASAGERSGLRISPVHFWSPYVLSLSRDTVAGKSTWQEPLQPSFTGPLRMGRCPKDHFPGAASAWRGLQGQAFPLRAWGAMGISETSSRSLARQEKGKAAGATPHGTKSLCLGNHLPRATGRFGEPAHLATCHPKDTQMRKGLLKGPCLPHPL